MGKAGKAGWIGSAFVVLAVGGVSGYVLLGHSGSDTFDATAVSATPPTDADAAKFARSFLEAWSSGPEHYPDTAADTDAPVTAGTALRGYHDGLKLTALTFGPATAAGPDPKAPNAARVTYTVTAQVAGGTWTYPGALDVLKDEHGHKAVHWVPAVLFSGLRGGQHLEAGTVPAQASQVKVVAKDGTTELTAARYPSLADIATTIGQHAGSDAHADGGSGVAVVDSAGVKLSAVKVFQQPPPAVVVTTIDPHLESVAQQAVRDSHLGDKPTSVVVLDRHNGHILAIAYRGPNNDAINSAKAPGSTMKIITSATLFDQAGLNPSSNAPCLKEQTAAGGVFHNEDDVPVNPSATVQEAFAESCNTSFIKDGFHYLVNNGDSSALHNEAQDVFGMGSWSIGGGVATADPSIPTDSQGSDVAAQFIGQGKVTMSPLFLASVAATVGEGAFHQPVILPDLKQLATAKRPISASTAAALRQMMQAVVAHGTATPRLGGMPGVGAKTGTAEEATHTNGWLTAYDDDLAVASMVERGTSGVDSAGYVVKTVLSAD